MPQLEINVEGDGGAYAEVFKRCTRHVHLPDGLSIRMETLDHGMTSGKPSVAIILELPAEDCVVIAQTSVRLFQMAAHATLAKYGDLTDGAVLGTFQAGGEANLTLSDAVACPKCYGLVPDSCQFCPNCGAKL
jgi:hypothetical protein